MVTIVIPTSLRRFADGSSSVEVEAETVVDALRHVTEQYPDLRNHLFDDEDQIQSFVNVFVNDENIRDRENQATSLSEGDELLLVPAMAGG